MIAASDFLISIIVSAFALAGSIGGAGLTYRAVSRQARTAERNTDIEQVRTVNAAMHQEIDRLTEAERACMARVDVLRDKLQRVELRLEEARQEMREMQDQNRQSTRRIAELERQLSP